MNSDVGARTWLLWFAAQAATGLAYPIYLIARRFAYDDWNSYEPDLTSTRLLLFGVGMMSVGVWLFLLASHLARGTRWARLACLLTCCALAVFWWRLAHTSPYLKCCQFDEAEMGTWIGLLMCVVVAFLLLLRRPRRDRVALRGNAGTVLFVRALARGVDVFLLVLLALPFFSVHWAVFFFSPPGWDPVLLVTAAAAYAFYDAATTMLGTGTFGKVIFGLTVVPADGQVLSWPQAFLRSTLVTAAVITPLVLIVGPLLLVAGAFRSDKRMLHDVISKTTVVGVREVAVAQPNTSGAL